MIIYRTAFAFRSATTTTSAALKKPKATLRERMRWKDENISIFFLQNI